MKKFEGGVRYYTVAKVEIFFPEDQVVCRACPLMFTEYGTKRDICRKTGEFIPDPDRMIGGICPLIFSEDNNSEEGETEHVDSI